MNAILNFLAALGRGTIAACRAAGSVAVFGAEGLSHVYPGISLYDSKHRIMPFRYVRGGGQWVTHAAPKMVTLHPGSHAFFFIAKYRCDLRIAMVAVTVRVYPPNGLRQFIGPASGDAGVSDLAYCKGGTNDPGNLVIISPVVATERAAYPAMAR